MPGAIKIAVDAMGGDRAPSAIVEGTLAALQDYEDVEVLLVGRRAEVEGLAAGGDPARLTLVDAPDVIGMDESPAKALRQKPASSIGLCAKLLAEGQAAAVVSAGNTGAVVAAALFAARLLPGVHRPGIAVTIPTRRGATVLCDVGANLQLKPAHYVQYAVMASAYSQAVLGVASPRVALLNIGTEESKGGAGLQAARAALEAAARAGAFDLKGSVEGNHIFEGVADVVVCDGFVGNTILKAAEGVGRAIVDELEAFIGEQAPVAAAPGSAGTAGSASGASASRDEALGAALRRLQELTDYTSYGGAPLLGIDGCAIIAHGRSDARAVKHAVRMARDYAREQVNERIVAQLSELTRKGVEA